MPQTSSKKRRVEIVSEPEPPSTPADPNDRSHIVLEVGDLSKRFCRDLKLSLLYGVQDIARELVGLPVRTGKLRKHEFWALNKLDFELPRGTAMGLVGMNGSGKTTLMRILSGLIKPTTGQVTVRGRLAPLLALGAGFNHVLTGRENIYTNMTILGLTKEEIDERFDAVVDFSEIGYALDAPVQNFSSGMVARLGFACALHTQPDFLLLDEVLAVGDLRFRQKCIDAIHRLRKTGTSFFVVHHSPDILGALCDQAMYLVKGTVEMTGAAKDVLAKYSDDVRRKGSTVVGASREVTDSLGVAVDPDIESENGKFLRIEVASHRDDGVEEKNVIWNEAPSSISFSLHVEEELRRMNILIELMKLPTLETLAQSTTEVVMAKFSAKREAARMSDIEPGDYEFRLDFPWLALLPGTYQVRISAYMKRILVARARSDRFEICAMDEGGLDNTFFQPRKWTIDSKIEMTPVLRGEDEEDEVLE